jgi:hypothetical protein
VAEELERQMVNLLSSDQLARARDLLIGELVMLRERALAKQADPAAVNELFRRRRDLFRAEPSTPQRDTGSSVSGCLAPPGAHRSAIRWKTGMPDDGEYSVWW